MIVCPWYRNRPMLGTVYSFSDGPAASNDFHTGLAQGCSGGRRCDMGAARTVGHPLHGIDTERA